MSSLLDDLMFDEDDLFGSSPARSTASARERAAREEWSAEWVASHCGACYEAAASFAHQCRLVQLDKDHVVPLHSSICCSNVVMPIEGFYFCDMTCLHSYNSMLQQGGVTAVMPDGGAGNESENSFVLPARPRPDAPLQQSPFALVARAEEDEEDAEVEEVGERRLVLSEATGEGTGSVEPTGDGRVGGVGAPLGDAQAGMRFCLEECPGVIVNTTRGGKVVLAFDDSKASRIEPIDSPPSPDLIRPLAPCCRDVVHH